MHAKKISFSFLFFVVAISPLLAFEEIDRNRAGEPSENSHNSEIIAEKNRESYQGSSEGYSDDGQSSSSSDGDSSGDGDYLSNKINEAQKAADYSKHAREELEGGGMTLGGGDIAQMEKEARRDRDYWLKEASKFYVPGSRTSSLIDAARDAQEEDDLLMNSLAHCNTARVTSENSFGNSYEGDRRNEPPQKADVLEKENKTPKTTVSLQGKNSSSVARILKSIVAAGLLLPARSQEWGGVARAGIIVAGLGIAHEWLLPESHQFIPLSHNELCSALADYNYNFPKTTRKAASYLKCPDFDLQAALISLPKEIKSYDNGIQRSVSKVVHDAWRSLWAPHGIVVDYYPHDMADRLYSNGYPGLPKGVTPSVSYAALLGIPVGEDVAWNKSIEALKKLQRYHEQKIRSISDRRNKASDALEKAALTQELENAQQSKKLIMRDILGRLHGNVDNKADILTSRAQDFVSKLRSKTLNIRDQKTLNIAHQAIQDAIDARNEECRIFKERKEYVNSPSKTPEWVYKIDIPDWVFKIKFDSEMSTLEKLKKQVQELELMARPKDSW